MKIRAQPIARMIQGFVSAFFFLVFLRCVVDNAAAFFQVERTLPIDQWEYWAAWAFIAGLAFPDPKSFSVGWFAVYLIAAFSAPDFLTIKRPDVMQAGDYCWRILTTVLICCWVPYVVALLLERGLITEGNHALGKGG